ncbi:MAG: glycosyl hydrolase family 18 protein [Firmicutes bacterium]|jgi:spore germination protein YaaH|nr:glycosyl hydrolase family 18 protein [Bacillota bacterium]
MGEVTPRLTPGGRQNNWYYVTTAGALRSLREHCSEISYLVPFWYGITSSGTLVDQSDPETRRVARECGLPVIAIVHNYSSREASDLVHEVITTPSPRQSLTRAILAMLNRERYAGVNIDFEFVPPGDRQALTAFVRELNVAISPLGYLLTISVPAKLREDPAHPFSGAFDYPALGEIADYLYVLAYDEHFGTPGPVASTGFVRTVLDYATQAVERTKIVLGMAAYGYDWAGEAGLPTTLTHSGALALAERRGAVITFDREAGEPTFMYTEDGVEHTVWFEDARSMGLKLELARARDLPGIAVWRLGQEDPEVWRLIRRSF